MFNSIIRERNGVHFPAFNGEKHYMVPFLKRFGLPNDLSHWQETVDDMLDGIETDEPIYFMADQAFVKAGRPHRRPGVHVDGYWVPDLRGHSGGGGSRHRGYDPLGGHKGVGRHRGYGRHASGMWDVPSP